MQRSKPLASKSTTLHGLSCHHTDKSAPPQSGNKLPHSKALRACVSRLSLLCLTLVNLLPSLHAEDKTPPDPAAHTVFIPFDQTQPVKDQKPQRYYLDRADFDRLWSLAKENRKPAKVVDANDAKPEATLDSALYRAAIEDERLIIEAQYQVTTRGHWAKARLGLANPGWGAPLPLRDLIVDGKPGAMANGEITFEQPGQHTVHAAFDLMRERNWKQAAMSLPASRAALLSLKLGDQDAMPRFADAKLMAVEETIEGARTVTVVLGSTGALGFDRVQRRPISTALPPSAEVSVMAGSQADKVLHGFVDVRFAFPGAARKEVTLVVDPDWIIDGAPSMISGNEKMRDVRFSLDNDAGRQRLVASFPHEISEEVKLHLMLSPKSPNPAHTPFVTPLATRWETTAVLRAWEGMQFVAKPTASQQRLSIDSYRLGTTDTLAFDIKPADDKTEARIDYVYQLSEQKQEVAAAIALKRERGDWRQLRISLSPGMEIQSVQSPNVIGWELQGGELFLRFNDLTGKEARVVIHLASSVLKASKTWTLTPLKLAGIDKVRGTAIIAAHAATEARLDGFQQEHDLREIDPGKLTATFTITAPLEKKRAIEFERAAWSLNVGLQDLPTRFSADGILLVQATDLGVLVSQQVSINVEQGALKHLILRLPKALPEATVTGEQLREVQSHLVGELREYDCTFQSQGGLLGHTALTFDMQLPLTEAGLSIPFVEITDAERLRRWFVLDNSSSRESKILQADGADACAKDALPYLPEVLTRPQFYQGRTTGGLKVAYTQLQASSGNAAVVTLADITTVLRADGERWDTVVYSLSNRSLQFLPVVLPDKSELMAVTVSGEPVRADEEQRNGQRVRLVPLIQTRPGERSMEIRLVYRIKGGSLGKHIKLDDPDLAGITAERTVWTASLPKGWTIDETLRDTFGNMEPIAEEGRDIEKLQSWMSDLGRINRAVSGSKDFKFNDAAINEAEKLNQQIAAVTKQVESKSKSRYAYRDRGKDSKEADKFAYQVEGDLSKVKEELGRQVVVLNDNKVGQPKLGQDRQVLGNTWCMTGAQGLSKLGKAGAGQSLSEYQEQMREAQRLAQEAQSPVLTQDNRAQAQAKAAAQGQKVQALEQDLRRQFASTLGLNDNVAVNNGFFTGGTTLTGGNTFTGGVTLSGRVAPSGGTTRLTGGLTKSGTAMRETTTISGAQTTVGNDNQTSFGNSNARAYGNIPGQAAVIGGTAATGIVGGWATARPGATSSLEAGKARADSPAAGNASGSLSIRGSAGTRTENPASHATGADGLRPTTPQLKSMDRAAAIIAEDGDKARKQMGLPALKAPSSALALAAEAPAAPPLPAAPASTPDPFAMPGEAPAIDSGYLTTQAVNQLRPTGRRSLQIEVPLTGKTFHFRKLKDHAVLDLTLKHPWQEGKTEQATAFGIGLGIWGLLVLFSARRRKRVAQAQ